MSTDFKCHICRSGLSVRKNKNGRTFYVDGSVIFINAECPICYENQESLIAFPCGHPICKECLKKQNLEIEQPYRNDDNRTLGMRPQRHFRQTVSHEYVFHEYIYHEGEVFSCTELPLMSAKQLLLQCNIVSIGKRIGTSVQIIATPRNSNITNEFIYYVYKVNLSELFDEYKKDQPSSIVSNQDLIHAIKENPKIFHYAGENYFYINMLLVR